MSRITRRGALIAALAAGLVFAAPAAAQAHVGVSPDAIEPGGSAVLTFSFTHGCEDSPTTALRVTMPEGLASVSPTVDGNWDIAVERADNGLVSAVTYTAVSPIPSDLRGAASMAVRLGEDAPESLAFPVEQACESGVNEWVEIAEDGADPHDLDSPAPVVTITADGEGTTDAAHAEHSDSQGQEQTQEPTAAAPPAGAILGGAGLLTGIAALVVAVLAYRRSA
ncbi:YcnI family protein [Microbacterium sp.]|uniref:YcnI family copper-binding membrane protein n=1 Tax=Microbacterium sp. TaxID=51671 RepID=UPI002736DC52|nr:YcnI family protein [Microbacterium sp.]MDP3952630.1 YcnI family protein [Microbacterium sp.]